jgi:DNA-binding transcriptional LysR family regulator
MAYMLDIRKLRMLAELDRLGTIAAVARELRLTAPGVSMQLAALEREVGIPLTERTGRGVALTPAGRLLAQHGADIVDRLSVAEMEATALRDGAAGTYRVAAFPSAVRTIVADAWGALLGDSDSGIRLSVVELEPRDAVAALAAGEVELAVTHSYSNASESVPRGMTATRVATEPVWLATRVEGDTAALADFATDGWIVPHRDLACYEMIQRACGLAGFEPRVVAEATDFAAQLALVAAGVGVALVPKLTVAELPDGVHLRELRMPVFRHVFVVVREATEADAGARSVRARLAASAARLVPDRVPG